MSKELKQGLMIVAAMMLGLFVLGMCSTETDTAQQSPPPPPAALLPSAPKLRAVLAEHPAWRSEWERVEVEQTGKDYRIGLFYREMPSGHRVTERDGKQVAQAALDELVASGRNPASEPVFLSVWLKREERGVTNQDQVRMFGSVTYDASNDSLTYRPYK